MDIFTFKERYKKAKEDFVELSSFFNENSILMEINVLKESTYSSNFWDDNKSATQTLKKIKILEDEIKLWKDFTYSKEEAEFYFDLLNEDDLIDQEHIASLNSFLRFIEQIEIMKMLSRKYRDWQ